MTRRLLSLCPLLGLALGCNNIDSQNVRTDGIYADLSASADGSGSTRLQAVLRAGGSTSLTTLDLSAGDTLTAYAGAQALPMSRESLFGLVSYVASAEADAAGTPLRVELVRDHPDGAECGQTDAPSSTATLPAPFALTAPAEDAGFSRGNDAIEVTWSGSGQSDPMSWSLSGPCIQARSGQLSQDSGRMLIAQGDVEALSPREQSESCAVELRLSRTRSGTVDPGYGEGGRFTAEQRRVVHLLSRP